MGGILNDGGGSQLHGLWLADVQARDKLSSFDTLCLHLIKGAQNCVQWLVPISTTGGMLIID